jgi:hypothetical protein
MTEKRPPGRANAHADDSDIIVLSDTETLRVLDVRGPSWATTERGDTHGDTDSYAVQAEERFRVDERFTARPLSLVPSAPRVLKPAPAAPAKPAAIAETPRKPAPQMTRGLADSLKDLGPDDLQVEHEDLSSTTGVRHLRIEIQRKARGPVKTSGRPRKR